MAANNDRSPLIRKGQGLKRKSDLVKDLKENAITSMIAAEYVQNIILNKVNDRINNIEIDKKKGVANISYMRNTIKNFMNYLA
jgi:hypothetical protein